MSETGGPQVMKFEDVENPTPAADGIVVQVGAAGVNYIDTYHRSGLYDMSLPLTPGLEGSGTVTAVGADVSQWRIGDNVAWTGAIGSYAEQVAMPAASAVAVPDGVSDDVAAASMLQGLTAHYLVDSTYPLNEGDKCVVHAAAGGVGLLLVQMAKMRGAEVFATVGTDEKADLARGAGADHVIMYRDVDFAEAIEDIAGTNPIDVVYDGVGAPRSTEACGCCDAAASWRRLAMRLVQFQRSHLSQQARASPCSLLAQACSTICPSRASCRREPTKCSAGLHRANSTFGSGSNCHWLTRLRLTRCLKAVRQPAKFSCAPDGARPWFCGAHPRWLLESGSHRTMSCWRSRVR